METMDRELVSLIEDHLGMAEAISVNVWKTAPHALDIDELRSLAFFGLTQAAARWRPYCDENGYDSKAYNFFKGFASSRIRGAIYDAIRSNDWTTRTLRGKSKKLKEAGQDNGASVSEMAERTGMSEQEVSKTLARMAAKPVSLQAASVDCEDNETTEGSIFEQDVRAATVEAIKSLPFEYQLVLAMHYYEGKELKVVAAELKITDARASNLHTKAVLAVREAMVEIAKESL
jgi:RNA polymerase sigma factor for flagellar operon FliA